VGLRVLVCGGRHYPLMERVYSILDDLNPDLVIQGGASGADLHARTWANMKGRACATFPAQWTALGPEAGPIRNRWMLKYGRPDLVIAFPGGAGTHNMVQAALAAGVKVRDERR